MVTQIKQNPARILASVADEKRFFCQDGSVLASLSELAERLRQMRQEAFRYHATYDKNDFANWVRDVLGDEVLAKKLRSIYDQLEASKVVANKVAWLESKRPASSRSAARR